MEPNLVEVENLLNYRFKKPDLLKAAFTHPSCRDSINYERLEFAGDALLQILVTYHLLLTYPHLDPGYLSLLRAANVSTEKLARVAVRHNLYPYVRRNAPVLDDKVKNFILAIQEEPEETSYWGQLKAPKVLADIVESIAAAIYQDCGFDLQKLWMVFRELLEPMVTQETLQHQPVAALYQFCQKHGKQVDIEHSKEESTSIVRVFIDNQLVTTATSQQKEMAKIGAARKSLEILVEAQETQTNDAGEVEKSDKFVNGNPKQNLYQLCRKRSWSKPVYRIDKEEGPAHERNFVCSVEVEGTSCIFMAQGEPKPKLKEAEISAALRMLVGLFGGNSC